MGSRALGVELRQLGGANAPERAARVGQRHAGFLRTRCMPATVQASLMSEWLEAGRRELLATRSRS